ncbi:hypothetical protein ACIBCR_15305 [Micromonospora echinospora]|uniref:hypothetical protein n=1 Tax=Micromonospora echinospora TaxID=1877 RepID=UPI0037927EBE
MPTVIDRIRTQRHVEAMAALDTFGLLTARIRKLLSWGRRITVTQRYTYVDQPPTVTAGLMLDTSARRGGISEGGNADGRHFGVALTPGLMAGFGFSAYASDGNRFEADVWKRYHAGKNSTEFWDRRRNMTQVTINGGMDGDTGPARDDLIVIRAWNSDGVCDEKVIAFDYGPENGVCRLARHLYVSGGGAGSDWDTGRVPDGVYSEYEQHAEAAIAAYEGRGAA